MEVKKYLFFFKAHANECNFTESDFVDWKVVSSSKERVNAGESTVYNIWVKCQSIYVIRFIKITEYFIDLS